MIPQPGTPTLPDIDPNGGGDIPDYPYWKPTEDTISLYYGDVLNELHIYKYSEDNKQYFLYNNTFYTEDQLKQQQGFTETPSIPIPEGWYNPELDKYWITDKGGWYNEIPLDGDYMNLVRDSKNMVLISGTETTYSFMDLS